jgi:hypothetical protein
VSGLRLAIRIAEFPRYLAGNPGGSPVKSPQDYDSVLFCEQRLFDAGT